MTKGKVLVTGATGFIGSHVLQQLVAADYDVVASVRSLKNEQKVADLKSLVPDTEIQIVEADLTSSQEVWEAAMKDCEYLVHVAAVLMTKPTSTPEDDLIRPNVEGTRAVMNAAVNTPTLKRVVLTSSIAAVGKHPTKGKSPEDRFGPDDWSDKDFMSDFSSGLNAYATSKTDAERVAWQIAKDKVELVSINPGLVLGPVLLESSHGSVQFISSLMMRRFPAVPDVHSLVADVRDVAKCHIVSLEHQDAPGKRFIACHGDPTPLMDMAIWLDEEFKSMGYSIPTSSLPTFLLRIVSLWDGGARMILPGLGQKSYMDTSLAPQVLGVEWCDPKETVIATGHSLVKVGLVTKKPGYQPPQQE